MNGVPVYVMMAPEQIRRGGGTQSRVALQEATVAEYAEAMADGAEFPPLVVFDSDAGYCWLADGFHRLAAHDRARPGEQIRCEVRKGSLRDAMLYAAGANASHGLRRSREDKRKAVRTLLLDQEWGRWSSREIARQCHVSHTFVDKVRWEIMDEDGDTGNVAGERVYTDRHGNETTMTLPTPSAAALPPNTCIKWPHRSCGGGCEDRVCCTCEEADGCNGRQRCREPGVEPQHCHEDGWPEPPGVSENTVAQVGVPGLRTMFRDGVLAESLLDRVTGLVLADRFALFDALIEAGYRAGQMDDMTPEATAALDEIEAFDAPGAAGDGDGEGSQQGDDVEDPAPIRVVPGEPFPLSDGRIMRVVEATCNRSERYTETLQTGWRTNMTLNWQSEFTPDSRKYMTLCDRAHELFTSGIVARLCVQSTQDPDKRLLVLESLTASDQVWSIGPGRLVVCETPGDAAVWSVYLMSTTAGGGRQIADYKVGGGPYRTKREAEGALLTLAVENGWEPVTDAAKTALAQRQRAPIGDIFTGAEPDEDEARRLQQWRFEKILAARQEAAEQSAGPAPLEMIAAHLERIRESARVIEDLVDTPEDVDAQETIDGLVQRVDELETSVCAMTRAAMELDGGTTIAGTLEETGLSEPRWVSGDDAEALMRDMDWRNADKITAQLEVWCVLLDEDNKRILELHPQERRLAVAFEAPTKKATREEFRRVTSLPDYVNIARVYCEPVPGFLVYCTRDEHPLASSTGTPTHSVWVRFDTPAGSWHMAKGADGSPMKYESESERDEALAAVLAGPFALEA